MTSHTNVTEDDLLETYKEFVYKLALFEGYVNEGSHSENYAAQIPVIEKELEWIKGLVTMALGEDKE